MTESIHSPRWSAKAIFAFILLITASLATPFYSSQAAEEGGGDGEDGRFFEIAPVSVSVVQNNRVVGYLSVSYKLMLVDLDAVARVANMVPRLSDASVKILARIARTRMDVSKPLNIELVHTYLQRTVDQVLGEGVARVLIQEASLQPG